jgi:hypothetical protein
VLRTLLRVATLAACGVALLAYPAAFGLDALFGKDVWLVEEQTDASVVAIQRSQWKADHPDGKPGDPREVAEIYGTPLSRERVILFSDARLLVPPEDPSVAVLRVTKASENPLQRRTVRYAAKWVAIGAAAAALVGFLLLRVTRRRVAPPASAGTPA